MTSLAARLPRLNQNRHSSTRVRIFAARKYLASFSHVPRRPAKKKPNLNVGEGIPRFHSRYSGRCRDPWKCKPREIFLLESIRSHVGTFRRGFLFRLANDALRVIKVPR